MLQESKRIDASQLVKCQLTTGEEEMSFPGWINPLISWNGFVLPWFSFLQVQQMADWYKEHPEYGTIIEIDGYQVHVIDVGSGEVDIHGWKQLTTGEIVYAIGAYQWTWEVAE